MSKLIVEETPNGLRYYRIRRGRKVEIPAKWVFKTTHRQTVRKRK